MADHSVEAWKSWKDAQLKYDYYMVGLVAALFAYVGSNYIPQKFAFSQNTLELISIIILAISLIVGIKRLEIDLQLQTITLKQCEVRELKKAANTIAANGGSNNLETGGFITVLEANERASQMQSALNTLDEAFRDKAKNAQRFFIARNWALTLGFITLAASKVVGVYSI
jgi:FtsZ-binding cell division protein ZapB